MKQKEMNGAELFEKLAKEPIDILTICPDGTHCSYAHPGSSILI